MYSLSYHFSKIYSFKSQQSELLYVWKASGESINEPRAKTSPELVTYSRLSVSRVYVTPPVTLVVAQELLPKSWSSGKTLKSGRWTLRYNSNWTEEAFFLDGILQRVGKWTVCCVGPVLGLELRCERGARLKPIQKGGSVWRAEWLGPSGLKLQTPAASVYMTDSRVWTCAWGVNTFIQECANEACTVDYEVYQYAWKVVFLKIVLNISST